MNKKYTLLMLLMMLTSGIAGAQTLYRYGFCDGRVGTDAKLTVEGQMNVEAAIHLTADELTRFSGDAFAGVNAGLTSKLNVHSLTVWVRESLEGENLAETTIDIRSSQKPRDGWNNITFETPVDIEPATDYYVGYTVEQTKTSSAIAFADGSHAGASWVKEGDGSWAEHNDLGVLCIEALISGDNLPQNDMALLSASLSDTYYIAGKPISLTYEITNQGMQPVTYYVLTVKAEGTDIEESRTIYQNINYGVTRSYIENFTFENLEPGRSYNFIISINDPNGIPDETMADNSLTIADIPVVEYTFPRTVLLEEFTTEKCSNCPAAAETVHDMIESLSEDERSRFAMACHHSGFGIDAFTLPCDPDYIWFYNNDGKMYAPAFMLDRVRESGSAIATPVFGNPLLSGFIYKVTQAQNVPALYGIKVGGTHDEPKREITVTVGGSTVLPIFDNPRITVYVVEDNVLATDNGKGQAGSGGKTYYHNHVLRAYNATWGEDAVWDGMKYNYECTLSYPEGCSPSEMQVIAFISNYDDTNPVNCEIGNTAWVELSQLNTTSTPSLNTSEEENNVMIYDLSGRLVNTDTLSPGIYIRTRTTSSGIESDKIVIR